MDSLPTYTCVSAFACMSRVPFPLLVQACIWYPDIACMLVALYDNLSYNIMQIFYFSSLYTSWTSGTFTLPIFISATPIIK